MLSWIILKQNFHFYRESLRRMEFAQIRARLRNLAYFSIVSRFPQLQKHINAMDDEDLWDSLNLMGDIRDPLIQAGDNDNVSSIIAEVFKSRTAPQFFFDVKDVLEICELAHILYANEISDVVRRAEEIVQGIFRFDIGEPVHFGSSVQWDYYPSGYAEWAVRLNSFYYAVPLCQASLYTGDAKFADKCVELIKDWIYNNPVGRSPAWQPMAVSLRILHWIWIYHLLLFSPALSAKMASLLLKSFFLHGEFLVRHLEIDQANNHLLFNAAALIMLGTVFPEFKTAGRWRRVGLNLLQKYLPDLICSDGVYAERSSHYQLLVLDLLLKTALLLERNGHTLSSSILKQLHNMAEFLVSLRRPNGSLPMLGDSFDESDMCHLHDTLFVAGAFFKRADWCAVAGHPSLQALWVLGKDAIKYCLDSIGLRAAKASSAFPVGGYWIMRNAPSQPVCHIVVDGGPFGLYRNPAHGHCDALSFDFFYDGHSMVIDPGTYEYGNTRWRNYFRGTSAHNTVVVDGQEQSELWGKSRVGRMANATCNQWLTTDWCDYFDGAHDGYKRLEDPVIHQRRMFLAKGENPFLLIHDCMEGKGAHEFISNLHLAPLGKVSEFDKDKVVISFGDTHGLVIVPLFPTEIDCKVVRGQEDPPLGWVSYRYGTKTPTTAISTRVVLECPASFGYLLLPIRNEGLQGIHDNPPLHLDVCDHQGSQIRDGVAVQLYTAGCTNVVVMNRECSSVLVEGADLETSARVLWIQFNGESALQTIMGINFSTVTLRGQLFMQASRPLPWVRAELDGAKISLRVPGSGKVALLLRAPKVLDGVTVNGTAVTYIRNDDYIELHLGEDQ